MIRFDPPNLDDATAFPDELDALADVMSQLSLYATWKAMAIKWRLKGDVDAALRLEAELDAMHRSLPDWARW